MGFGVVHRKGFSGENSGEVRACPMGSERTHRGQREFEDTERLVTHWGNKMVLGNVDEHRQTE